MHQWELWGFDDIKIVIVLVAGLKSEGILYEKDNLLKELKKFN